MKKKQLLQSFMVFLTLFIQLMKLRSLENSSNVIHAYEHTQFAVWLACKLLEFLVNAIFLYD